MDSPHDELHCEIEMGAHAMPHDSMVTVRLSEPPSLTIDTKILAESFDEDSSEHTKVQSTPDIILDSVEDDIQEDSPRITRMDPNGNEITSPTGSESAASQDGESRTGSDSSGPSEEGGVNWEELEKTEEQEPRDQGSDDVSLGISAYLDFADWPVYCFITCQTRTRKQSPSHQPEVRPRQGQHG